MNFVVLGNICIDKNNIEGVFYKRSGGPPNYISKFLIERNENLAIISSYGKDFLRFKDALDIYPKSPNISKTLVYENIIKNGKRSQKCYFYKEALPPAIDKDMTNILKIADVLFIAPLIPYFSPDYVKKIVNLTSKKCLKILLPQGYFRDFDIKDNVIFRQFKDASKILPLFDFVVLSAEDYPDIKPITIEWNRKYGSIFIITKGEKGAVVINNGEKTEVPTSSISNFNSIGAGDTFSAAFGYYYLKTKNLIYSVSKANREVGKRLSVK